MRHGSEMPRSETTYWTQCSGRVGRLQITQLLPEPRVRNEDAGTLNSAEFGVEECFLHRILSSEAPDPRYKNVEEHLRWPKFKLDLPSGERAEIFNFDSSAQGDRKYKSRRSFSVVVENLTNPLNVKGEIEALLILASFASRESSRCWYWQHTNGRTFKQEWRFDVSKSDTRDDHEDPLLRRSREHYAEFLRRSMDVYRRSIHQDMLNHAIYAQLARNMPLELRIARYFAGIQGALMFALQKPRSEDRDEIGPLFRRFIRDNPRDFSDLWPLANAAKGASLTQIRNAIVHGEAFSEEDFRPLSFAAENLQWYLERIILIALGWKVEQSAVSPSYLMRSFAYNWKEERRNFKLSR